MDPMGFEGELNTWYTDDNGDLYLPVIDELAWFNNHQYNPFSYGPWRALDPTYWYTKAKWAHGKYRDLSGVYNTLRGTGDGVLEAGFDTARVAGADAMGLLELNEVYNNEHFYHRARTGEICALKPEEKAQKLVGGTIKLASTALTIYGGVSYFRGTGAQPGAVGTAPKGGTAPKPASTPIDPTTARMLDDYKLDPNARVYRWTEPQYIDPATMQASGNPGSIAQVADVYNPFPQPVLTRRGILHQPIVEAADLGVPSLNVTTRPATGYKMPGGRFISIRVGDIIEQGGKIYPDVGATFQQPPPVIITVPKGKIPFTFEAVPGG
jgi:hypothetical protein